MISCICERYSFFFMGEVMENNRTQWYRDARFGMFIHWGVYAVPARGEWVMSDEKISVSEYQKYVRTFRPEKFNAEELAQLAKEAGMKYAVMTAKHHDGYCMFDSQLTDYTSVKYTGHDFIREYIDAFRRAGLKIGLYYSLLDWHHEDYPHYGDRHHPMRDNIDYKDREHDFGRYLEYMHGQIRELCTSYGKIDILWTDFSYDDMRADTWQGEKLVRMIRSLQPDIILNNRLEASGEGFGSLLSAHPNITSGDFVSPEQIVPPEGIRNEAGEPIMWESCVTMNNHWGYCRDDHYFKPADMILHKLTECVSKGGNLLLNVGPDEQGQLPEEETEILKQIGSWMKINHESIYGCGPSGIAKPEYGRITRNGDHIYYHVYEGQFGGIPLPGIRREDIASIRLLGKGNVRISDSWITSNYPELVFADLGEDPVLPDRTGTVIEIILKECDR